VTTGKKSSFPPHENRINIGEHPMEDNGMIIKTTINIRIDLLERIRIAATRAGVPVSVIISALLRRYAGRASRRDAQWNRVRYQPRAQGAAWRKQHIQLGAAEYEYCIDLRKVMKFSVSRLVAEAVELYLEELFDIVGDDFDTYRLTNYAKSHFVMGNAICWIYYWNIPPTLLTPKP
jgi:hypothetical protein